MIIWIITVTNHKIIYTSSEKSVTNAFEKLFSWYATDMFLEQISARYTVWQMEFICVYVSM